MKNFLAHLFIFLFLFFCVSPAVAGNKMILKAGHLMEVVHPYHLGLMRFAELVKEKTNGDLVVEVYPQAQMGNERDMIEGVSMGSLDLVLTTNAPLTNFCEEFGAFEMPFLFKSHEHAYAVFDGDIGGKLMEKLGGMDLVGLAYFENGFRNITNNKRKIETPKDLEGLKIRVMESPVHIATFRILGANPTPMAWSEVFTALAQGTIDGQENPIMSIYSAKIFEVNKYLSMTGHFYSPAELLINKNIFDGLSEEQQRAVKEAAGEARDYQRQEARRQSTENLQGLVDNGMVVSEVDRELFRGATKSVYEQFAPHFGDIVAQIEALK